MATLVRGGLGIGPGLPRAQAAAICPRGHAVGHDLLAPRRRPGHPWPPNVYAGALPDGATLERPEGAGASALEEARQAKVWEIDAAYEGAFAATMTMPQADAPTGPDVTAGAALFAVDDPDGLAYVVAQLNATRQDLLAQGAAAETVEAVTAIVVRYVV